MKYEIKKKITDILLLPVYGISKKLGFYLRGIMIQNLRTKIRAIKKQFPNFSFWRAKMMSGGANFCFLVDNKYVIKIKKNYTHETEHYVMREKEITDAVRKSTKIAVPDIQVYKELGYLFSKYDLIDGKNLNTFSLDEIIQHREQLGRQLAQFIYAIHRAGFSHNDMANNILVDPKTMKVTGVIDWEFATKLLQRNDSHDFYKLNRNNENKIKTSNLVIAVMREYYSLAKTSKRK
jgi:tRNA A-37 threonylcarbamoyl transferase component Bud32